MTLCRAFPWVLEVFGVSAYHFYKLVEPAIKQERDFPRAIVKHLNRVSHNTQTHSRHCVYCIKPGSQYNAGADVASVTHD